ncbi:acyl carrier protein [Granulicella mallensis]|uniref:Acyl carrier protein n=2 Tax=Granulicella mallensis TaxID=940614 RepID=A0A7W7ZWB8_9BACT|nr:acyl carrier protein [Granulicella mallensis]
MESFPLSPNGKLDRKSLPAPDDEAYVRRGYEAPVGEMEETVAGVFAEVLGVERVGRNDSFFELGGHSLMAMRVIARLEEQLGIKMSVREIFNKPTIASLGLWIDLTSERLTSDAELQTLVENLSAEEVSQLLLGEK